MTCPYCLPVLVARVELRRRFRSIVSGNPLQLVAIVLSGLFVFLFVLGATAAAHFAGTALRAGDLTDPVAYARIIAAALWLLVCGLIAFRFVVSTGPHVDPDALLAVVTHRPLVVGLLLAEAAIVFCVIALPTVLIAGAFGYGVGSALTGVLVGIAILLSVATAVPAGIALGFAVKVAFVRSAFLARHKLALGVLVFVVYMVAIVSGQLGALVYPVVAAVANSPIGWPADLALLVTDAAVDARRSALVPSLALLAIVVSVGACSRLAVAVWYADSPLSGERTVESAADRFAFLPALGLRRPPAAVVRHCWIRAWRNPISLVYVAYPLFLLFGPVAQAVETGTVPSSLPILIGLYGAWAIGASFALNPVGDAGSTLPATLTSGVRGRDLVRGHLVACLFFAPPVVIAVLALALLSPLSAGDAIATTVFATVLCLGAPPIAVGVGVSLPRFEAAQLTRSREAVVPSLFAFAAYSIALVVVSIPGVLVLLLSSFVVDALGIDPAILRLAGVLASSALVASVGWIGYRHACRTLDDYRID